MTYLTKPSDVYASGSGFMDNQDCYYETLEDLIQMGILGFCGCGSPEQNLEYVLGGLTLLDEKTELYDSDKPDWNAYHAKSLEHFGNEQAEYFFWYWLDTKGFTEHGGGVPGWLTEEGEKLLELLKEWKDELH